ncbi:hypothetical protein [Streptomyces mirabilis]
MVVLTRSLPIGDLRWDAEVGVTAGVRGDELPYVAVADQDR